MYRVYILECSDGTLYTGQTNNLKRRLKEHKSGRGAKYVKGRLPIKLQYSESFETRGEAMRRENQIKKLSKSKKLELITHSS